jgi:hypothetical protein
LIPELSARAKRIPASAVVVAILDQAEIVVHVHQGAIEIAEAVVINAAVDVIVADLATEIVSPEHKGPALNQEIK